MVIGHFGVGLGLKHFAPKTNLGWLTTAAVLSDLLWVVFLLLHLEQARLVPGITRFSPWDRVSVAWSHSLLLCLLWELRWAAAISFSRDTGLARSRYGRAS